MGAIDEYRMQKDIDRMEIELAERDEIILELLAEVEARTVALRRIRGWREVDLPEGNRCARAIEYIEQVADYALRGEGE